MDNFNYFDIFKKIVRCWKRKGRSTFVFWYI